MPDPERLSELYPEEYSRLLGSLLVNTESIDGKFSYIDGAEERQKLVNSKLLESGVTERDLIGLAIEAGEEIKKLREAAPLDFVESIK